MAEIRWTEESSRWLQDIYEYIAASNENAARKVVAALYEKAQVLGNHPEIGHKYEAASGLEVRLLLLWSLSNSLSHKEVRRHRYLGCISRCPRYRSLSDIEQ